MHNQSDDLDLDVQNLFLDESVELEERLQQSKALCTGVRTKLYLKYWLDAL